MRLSQDPDAGPNAFARVIEPDLGRMGQVPRFAKSAFFTAIPNPKVGTFDLLLLMKSPVPAAPILTRSKIAACWTGGDGCIH
jgi:hypothetical protein